MADFPGQLTVTGSGGEATVILNGTIANAELGNHGQDGTLRLFDGGGQRIVSLDAGNGDLKIGGHGRDGDITLFPTEATDIGTVVQATIHLDAQSGDARLGAHGRNGEIRLFPSTATDLRADDQATIQLHADAGDIELLNADAAEDFDTSGPAEPGDVMVLAEDDPRHVRRSRQPYDTRVVGVVAGAGGQRPGIVLGRDRSRAGRVPIALLGMVWAKVDATAQAIDVGDLLTTSARPGHAMRVQDPQRAFGAVLGKAMGRLRHGTGIVPVLVALQ